MAAGVSVVICTYTERRWTDLVSAVESVRSQIPPAREIVVVVDHNPALAERVRHELPDVRVVESSRTRGLSGARNTAVAACAGSVVAFLDDDAVAGPGWLRRLGEPYADPAVVAVGGAAEPVFPAERPVTLPAGRVLDWVVGCSYEGQPAVRSEVRNLMGCNMSFRRDVLAEVGGFAERLGRVGTVPLGCEETELCIRVRQRLGAVRIVFEPDAVVRHRVSPDRTTWRYLASRCWAEGRSKAVVSRMVGRLDALSAERRYLSRVVPKAFVRSPVVLTLALSCTAGGYLWGLRAG